MESHSLICEPVSHWRALRRRASRLSARWKLFGFLPKTLCFFGKAFFKGFGLFETATHHGTISCIRVLNRRVLQFRS